jgi:hypothetical protein
MDEASYNIFVGENPENHEAISYIQLLAELKRQLAQLCQFLIAWAPITFGTMAQRGTKSYTLAPW